MSATLDHLRPPPALDEVDAKIAARQALDEYEARADLGSLRNGPASDAWWARRWGWTARDVGLLRTTDWRDRAPLPR